MSDRRRVRCSSLAQLLACPASLVLRELVRPGQDSDASLIGSWCHYEGARRLVEFHGAVAADGALVPVKMPNGWEPEFFVRWIVDYWLQTVLTYCDADMALEVEAEMSHAFPEFDLTGHIDVVAFKVGDDGQPVEAIGLDLKTGTEIVDEAEQNAQVLGYIVLLKLAYPTLRKITFAICQPRNNPDEGIERNTWVTLEGAALDNAIIYLEREINTALANLNQLNSDGWKQCRYCPAADQCPAIDADIEDMKLTLTPELLANIAAEPSLSRLLQIERARKKLEPIMKKAHEALKARVESEGGRAEVDGVAIWTEERNSGRQITDNKAATEALAILPDEAFHGCYSFSAGDIEKALAAHESTRTGKKVPVDSTVEGKTSGKSLYRDLLGSITKMKTSVWLRVGE